MKFYSLNIFCSQVPFDQSLNCSLTSFTIATCISVVKFICCAHQLFYIVFCFSAPSKHRFAQVVLEKFEVKVARQKSKEFIGNENNMHIFSMFSTFLSVLISHLRLVIGKYLVELVNI